MARIPPQELERLKGEVSLVELARTRGVELRGHGDNLLGLCPFHRDTNPSLVINPTKNLWNCLGACQAGGTTIDWVMRSERVSFRHAVEMLQQMHPGQKVPTQADSAGGGGSEMGSALVADAEMTEPALLESVVEFYHARLKHAPDALDYLQRRGLGDAEMIRQFRIGFSDRTLSYHLPSGKGKARVSLRERLQSVGVLRDSGHEHLRGCAVFPITDVHGTVVNLYGRRVGKLNSSRGDLGAHLYLPGPHRGVFNAAALKASEKIILCEALIDALTFWCAGFRNVTSSYGVNGFTEEMFEAFCAHSIKQVYIAYDRDSAGDNAARSLAAKLSAAGVGCYRVLFPQGHDANSFALDNANSHEALRETLANAVWMGAGDEPALHEAMAAVAVPAALAAPEMSELAAADALPVPEETSDTTAPSEATEVTPSVGVAVAPTVLALSAAPAAALAPATPVAIATTTTAPELKDGEVVFRFGDRRWRIRGLEKNTSLELLKVNVLCGAREAFHIDTFDLYAARPRAQFLAVAAAELSLEESVLKRDLGKVLLALEELHEQRLRNLIEPHERTEVVLNDTEREEALTLLRDPRLLDRVLEDFARCGVVGEETNKLVGYLAALSRKLEKPLAVVIQSSSAAGKSALMEAVLSFVPEEDRVKYSAMTGQSLFYMGEADLAHKVLAIAEESGAEKASYALKLLQSEGELTIASTGKDPVTGRLVTHEYHVQGPVMIMLTTTAIEVDEELLNRCIVLSVDEEAHQTQAIHAMQRQAETLEGLLQGRDRARVHKLHANAQRLLRPILVANPFAKELTFLSDRTRTRRDHLKYLTLIRTVTFVHQYQRPLRQAEHQGERVEYIEVSLDDIRVANELAQRVLGRSLDELPPQTRRLLMLLDAMVREQCEKQAIERSEYRFSRREVRAYTGWGNTQLKVHLHRLEELEYVLVHRTGRGQSFVYELLYDGQGQDGAPFLPGLIDVNKLTHRYDAARSGSNAARSGVGRAVVGGEADQCIANEIAEMGSNRGGGRSDSQRTYRAATSENVNTLVALHTSVNGAACTTVPC